MKSITVTEFRRNIKKYAELAKIEKVVVNRGEGQSFAIVPIDEVQDSGYNPEFVKKIKTSIQEAKEGKITRVTTEQELEKFLDSL